MTEPRLDVRFGAATHQGLVRDNNEDSYLTVPPVFLVSDGMGGHAQGEVASRAVADAFLELAPLEWIGSDEIIACVASAAATVSSLSAEGRRPGATLSGVGVSQQGGMPCWLVFNIGDSRTYLLRGAVLTQISVDHSAIRAAAGDSAPRHVITRALGAGLARPVADQWLIPAAEGDRILICSDGLSNDVTDELVTATLLSVPDPREAASALVQAALNAGGHDNITAVVVDSDRVVSLIDSVGLDDSTESPDDTESSDDTVPDLLEVP